MTVSDDNLTSTHKADFGDIYSAPDPRPYFSSLLALDYQIPQRATSVVERVLHLAATEDGPPRMLDLCCSYGINSAMLFGPDGPAAAARRYTSAEVASLTSAELAAADRRYYRPRRVPAHVTGLDVSSSGVGYGLAAGLLDAGFVADLEASDPSPEVAAALRDTRLVVCTGGYGYVGPATFGRILSSVADPSTLWLVVFVLRVFDYAPTAELLTEHGLVTERLPGTYPQRRFADPDEQRAALEDVRSRGLDPTGLEADGWFHAECFLTRPASCVSGTPASSPSAGLAG